MKNVEIKYSEELSSRKKAMEMKQWPELLKYDTMASDQKQETGILPLDEFKEKAKSRIAQRVAELEKTEGQTKELKDISGCSLKELEQLCIDENLAENVDFHDFDIRVARAVVTSLRETKRDFPNLTVGYIGSSDSQIQGIHDCIASAYADYCRKSWGSSYDEATYIEYGKRKADEFIQRYKLNCSTAYAWSLSFSEQLDPTGKGLQRFNGIAINSSFASDYDAFVKAKEREVPYKHKPINCGTPKATCDHELGHEVARKYKANNDIHMRKLYQQMIDSGKAREVLSGYAATNIDEFIAEAYSEYRNNDNPRFYACSVYQRLLELRDCNENKI